MRLLVMGCLLLVAACGTVFGPTTVTVDVRFSKTARDPGLLGQVTEAISLSIEGDGLTEPIETRLAPVPQTVTLTVPPGYKGFVAKAWKGNRVLAQGEAGTTLGRGRQTTVILDLSPIDDAPGVARAMAGLRI
jgi:hypothetical protein